MQPKPRRLGGQSNVLKRSTYAFLAVCVLGCLGAAPAFAEEDLGPWFHLTSGSRPANLQPGAQARSEVQQLTVSATEGTYALRLRPGVRIEGLSVGEEPELLQAALEAEGLYGPGNIEVTASPGLNNHNEVYEMKFVGKLANQPVGLPEAKEEKLVGGNERITAKRTSEGRSAGGEIVVTATNLGDANTSGEVKIVDTLPSGLKAVNVVGNTPVSNVAGLVHCSVESESRVSCEFPGAQSELEDSSGAGLPPFRAIEVRIGVEVGAGASSSEENEVSVSGGKAPGASLGRKLKVSAEPTRFGVEDYELTPEEAGGMLDTQAGSHPFQAGFTVVMNQLADTGPVGSYQKSSVLPAALAKDLRFKLPPGLVGNPTAFPQCSIFKFLHASGGRDECPDETAMGVATVTLNIGALSSGLNLGQTVMTVPLFNVEPQVGEPARFGFYLPLAEFGVLIDTSVRTGDDYGVTSTTSNIAQTASFLSAQVTLWGV